jgi:hypothetical protein
LLNFHIHQDWESFILKVAFVANFISYIFSVACVASPKCEWDLDDKN